MSNFKSSYLFSCGIDFVAPTSGHEEEVVVKTRQPCNRVTAKP